MLLLTDLLQFAKQQEIPAEKRRGIVREYLQKLILFYLQQSNLASKLIFIGGTALRFFHNLQRFSEDLDFNYMGKLKEENLRVLTLYLQKEFGSENIPLEFSIRKSKESYFHWKIYLQFPTVLHTYKCASIQGEKLHSTEKLSIQLDFQNLGKSHYPVKKNIISHFGKRFLFNTADLDMFLAEKSNAILYRKPPRGRDFFDFMSIILSGGKINLQLMKMRKVEAQSNDKYKALIKKRIQQVNFVKLTDQLAPFLFHEEDIEIMRHFGLHADDLLQKL